MRKLLTIAFLLITLSVYGTKHYVSPRGNDANTGLDTSAATAWRSFQKGVDEVLPGDTIYFMQGVFNDTSRVLIEGGNGSGNVDSDTYYMAYPGHTVIFDYAGYDQQQLPGGNAYAQAIFLGIGAHDITFKNFTIRNCKQKDIYTEVTVIYSQFSYNLTFEHIILHDNGGRGFMHETGIGYNGVTYDTLSWINCDSYNNADSLAYTFGASPGNQSDGFKTYGEPGAVMILRGNRSWHNSDDGYDVGTEQLLTFENNWSFRNGYLPQGDGDGFKTGSHEAYPAVLTKTFKNNISAYNRLSGYFLLDYPDYYRNIAYYYNNLAIGNGTNGFSTSNNAAHPTILSLWVNNISYLNKGGHPFSNAYQPYDEHHNNWNYVPASFPGWEWANPPYTSAEDFVNLDSAAIVTELAAPRKSDGTLPDVTTLRLMGDSDFIGAGANIGMSASPNMGIDWDYYDTHYATAQSSLPTIYSNNATHIKSIQALLGGNITSDGGSGILARGIVWGYTTNPDLTDNVISVSGTTGNYAITLSGLNPNTTYYVRSYATNSVGTVYGSNVSFTTDRRTPVNTSNKIIIHNGKQIIIK